MANQVRWENSAALGFVRGVSHPLLHCQGGIFVKDRGMLYFIQYQWVDFDWAVAVPFQDEKHGQIAPLTPLDEMIGNSVHLAPDSCDGLWVHWCIPNLGCSDINLNECLLVQISTLLVTELFALFLTSVISAFVLSVQSSCKLKYKFCLILEYVFLWCHEWLVIGC